MTGRTPVFVYASDPLSAAGAKAQLMNQPTIELVGPADVDRARVALVIAETTDDSLARVIRAVQRDGIANVVLVATRFEEDGVITATAAGVTSFMRRADATSARLTETIREVDRVGCQLPEGLLRKAAVAQACLVGSVSGLGRASRGGESPSFAGEQLSPREAEVLRLVADGYDTTDIAEQLAYSESTIKGVLAKVMTRLDARNRCHVVAIAMRESLI